MSQPRFDENTPMRPAAIPTGLDLDDPIPPYSPLVADAEIIAHQSTMGTDVLNIEIDAPAGVTVRIHVNDGEVYEGQVPD